MCDAYTGLCICKSTSPLNKLTHCHCIEATFFFLISRTFCFTLPFQPRQLPLSLWKELPSPSPLPCVPYHWLCLQIYTMPFEEQLGEGGCRQRRKCEMLMPPLLTAALSAPFCTYMIMKQFALNLHLFKF